MSKKKRTYFKQEWLSMPGLSDWLKPHDSRTKFSCAACDKSYELFNKGILALNGTKGHDKGTRHIANVKLMLENRRLVVIIDQNLEN